MSTNGSPLKTTNMAPTRGLCGSEQRQMTMSEHKIIMPEIHWAKTLNSGNPRINFIHHHLGIVTIFHCHHFQVLPSSITKLHSTWNQAFNQTPVRPKDIRVMANHGKHMISAKEDMEDLKCSPLSNSHDLGHHLQAHLECLQHRLESIQSFGRPLPPPLQQDNFPANVGDPPFTSQRNDFRSVRNRTGQMLQGLPICPHYQICPITNTMQIMRVTIRWTCAVLKAKQQSAWRKQNSPWSNFPTGLSSPTFEPSTRGKKSWWLGFWRRSICPLCGDRSVWNSLEMDPCTGGQQLQIFYRVLRPGWIWKISIVLNGFGNSGLGCFWRNVQARFRRRGRREGEATSNRVVNLENTWARQREVPNTTLIMVICWWPNVNNNQTSSNQLQAS